MPFSKAMEYDQSPMGPEIRLYLPEIRLLEDTKVFLSRPQNGVRKVSAAILRPVFFSPQIHFRPNPIDLSQAPPLDLPVFGDSIAGLSYLGFTPGAALVILDVWKKQVALDLPNYSRKDFTKIVTEAIDDSYLPETGNRDLAPAEAMDRMGIAKELQDVFLRPEFRQLFRMQTLDYWLKNTMVMRWYALENLYRRLKALAQGKQPGQTNRDEEWDWRPRDPNAYISILPSSAFMYGSRTVRDAADGAPIDSPPPLPDDHLALYKSGGFDLFARYALTGGAGGYVNLLTDHVRNSYLSYDGRAPDESDSKYYFHPEIEAAEQYRAWAAARSVYSETWMLRLRIPRVDLQVPKEDLQVAKEDLQVPKQDLQVQAPPKTIHRKQDDVTNWIMENNLLFIWDGKTRQKVRFHDDTLMEWADMAKGKCYLEVWPAAVTVPEPDPDLADYEIIDSN